MVRETKHGVKIETGYALLSKQLSTRGADIVAVLFVLNSIIAQKGCIISVLFKAMF